MSASHGTEKRRHRTIMTQWHLKCIQTGKFFMQETSLSMETRREDVATGNEFSSASKARIGLWNCDLSNINQPTLPLFKIYNLEGNVTIVHFLHVISRELLWDQCDVARSVVSKIVQLCSPFLGKINVEKVGKSQITLWSVTSLRTLKRFGCLMCVSHYCLSSCLSITSHSAERGVETTSALQPNERTCLRTWPGPLMILLLPWYDIS